VGRWLALFWWEWECKWHHHVGEQLLFQKSSFTAENLNADYLGSESVIRPESLDHLRLQEAGRKTQGPVQVIWPMSWLRNFLWSKGVWSQSWSGLCLPTRWDCQAPWTHVRPQGKFSIFLISEVHQEFFQALGVPIQPVAVRASDEELSYGFESSVYSKGSNVEGSVPRWWSY
jgi:hypothetical protein